MKNLSIIVTLLYFSISSSAQSIGNHVISSAGVSAITNDASMYISIGEPMITEISNGEILIAQGFLQVTLIENTVNTSELLAEPINAYPNPTSSILNIEIPEMNGTYQWEVFDLNGQLIKEKIVSHNKEEIDFQSFDSGTYFLKVTKGNKSSRTLRIVKL